MGIAIVMSFGLIALNAFLLLHELRTRPARDGERARFPLLNLICLIVGVILLLIIAAKSAQ